MDATLERYPEMSADLALDAGGSLWAVWDSTTRRGSPSHRILASRWSKEGWSEPRTVAEGDGVLAPRVFAIGKGAWVLWESLEKEGPRILAAPAEGGDPGVLADGRQPAAVSGGGKAWLAFCAGSGDSWDVYVSTREAK